MKNLLIVITILFLVGCASTEVKPKIITKYERVKVSIPPEYFIMPVKTVNSIDVRPLAIDSGATTQEDVSNWVVDMYDYQKQLESIIQKIQEYNTKALTDEVQDGNTSETN